MRSVVSRAVPPQVDGSLRPVNHFGRHWLVRLAGLSFERYRIARTALQGVVERMNSDVVLCAGPEVCQAALDGVAGEDGTVDAVFAFVR